MKRSSFIGLSAIALVASVPLVNELPVSASWLNVGNAIAQNVQQKPQMQLVLSAEKKVVQKDQQGKEKVSWQPLQGNVTVQPGDVLRYTLTGENKSDRPIKDLKLNQPVPQGMAYVMSSAAISPNAGSQITYSIDQGKSFVAQPQVPVKQADGKVVMKPAPAEAYTNIRWTIGSAVGAKSTVKASYQAKVR
jgi:uncharacterized repeat protein (TIGR01451 family)